MTEPSAPRPVPGPPRPPAADPAADRAADPVAPPPEAAGPALADLERLPVAEHVAVFEAEHARLQRELSTIDQL